MCVRVTQILRDMNNATNFGIQVSKPSLTLGTQTKHSFALKTTGQNIPMLSQTSGALQDTWQKSK